MELCSPVLCRRPVVCWVVAAMQGGRADHLLLQVALGWQWPSKWLVLLLSEVTQGVYMAEITEHTNSGYE